MHSSHNLIVLIELFVFGVLIFISPLIFCTAFLKNPISKVKLPNCTKPEMKTLKKEELTAFLEETKRSGNMYFDFGI